MKRYLFVLISLIVFALIFSACSNDPTPEPVREPTLADKLQKVLDDGVESYNGIGISAAVIMPDGEKWVGVSGVSHVFSAITPDMPFSTGSIAKNFTAAAIFKLVEEGKLRLDDPLYEWLPPFPHVDSTITIRQLLNHTSGLDDIADNPDFWQEVFNDPLREWTPAELVNTFNREPVFPKGTDWNYSSTGYALLRLIIRNLTASEVSKVYRDRLFIPTELTNTFTSMGEALPSHIAHGWYDLDNDGYYNDFSLWPRTAFASGIGGEVWSTAEDLAIWARAMYHDKTVLSQTSLDQMLAFHAPCTGEEFMCAGYGLGAIKFNPELLNGLEGIGHAGDAPGYAAASIYFPEYKVCIGIMDNTEEGNAMFCLTDLISVITNYLDM